MLHLLPHRGNICHNLMDQGRRWTITLNNPKVPMDQLYHPAVMSYLIAGFEKAPTTGTPHYQIYLETQKRRTPGAWAKELAILWGSHPKVFKSKGTAEQNVVYSMKDQDTTEQFVEFGEAMKQGARTDLDEAIAELVGGASVTDLWNSHTSVMIKYHKGIKEAYRFVSPNIVRADAVSFSLEAFPKTEVLQEEIQMAFAKKRSVILWGESGAGKTCFAKAILPKALFVTHMDKLADYDPGLHDGIIFDDLSMSHLHREAQIHIFDCEQSRNIHIRYHAPEIPAGTKKIFTTNNYGGVIFMAGEKAIERRLQTFEFTGEWSKAIATPDEVIDLTWDEVLN